MFNLKDMSKRQMTRLRNKHGKFYIDHLRFYHSDFDISMAYANHLIRSNRDIDIPREWVQNVIKLGHTHKMKVVSQVNLSSFLQHRFTDWNVKTFRMIRTSAQIQHIDPHLSIECHAHLLKVLKENDEINPFTILCCVKNKSSCNYEYYKHLVKGKSHVISIEDNGNAREIECPNHIKYLSALFQGALYNDDTETIQKFLDDGFVDIDEELRDSYFLKLIVECSNYETFLRIKDHIPLPITQYDIDCSYDYHIIKYLENKSGLKKQKEREAFFYSLVKPKSLLELAYEKVRMSRRNLATIRNVFGVNKIEHDRFLGYEHDISMRYANLLCKEWKEDGKNFDHDWVENCFKKAHVHKIKVIFKIGWWKFFEYRFFVKYDSERLARLCWINQINSGSIQTINKNKCKHLIQMYLKKGSKRLPVCHITLITSSLGCYTEMNFEYWLFYRKDKDYFRTSVGELEAAKLFALAIVHDDVKTIDKFIEYGFQDVDKKEMFLYDTCIQACSNYNTFIRIKDYFNKEIVYDRYCVNNVINKTLRRHFIRETGYKRTKGIDKNFFWKCEHTKVNF